MKPRWTVMYSGFLVTGDVDGHLHEKMTICARDFGKLISRVVIQLPQEIMVRWSFWREVIFMRTLAC